MKNSNNYHDETAKENTLQLRKLQEAYVSGHWGELTAFILHI